MSPVTHASAPLLLIRDLVSHYGAVSALKGIDLAINTGEIVTIVGANGAGKTTLLRVISGLNPPTSGQISFAGEEISKLRANVRVKRGMCHSPEGRQVFADLSVLDNLMLGAFSRTDRHAIHSDLDHVLALFPILKEKLALPAGTMSGGQQQMLAIARALMGKPRLLLLDEPSMGLAPLIVKEIFSILVRLRSEGITILLVEQNAAAALKIADRGYVLETGRIVTSGPASELLNNDDIRRAYLGH